MLLVVGLLELINLSHTHTHLHLSRVLSCFQQPHSGVHQRVPLLHQEAINKRFPATAFFFFSLFFSSNIHCIKSAFSCLLAVLTRPSVSTTLMKVKSEGSEKCVYGEPFLPQRLVTNAGIKTVALRLQ